MSMTANKSVTIKDMPDKLWHEVRMAALASRKTVAEFTRILLAEALRARNGKAAK
jgi:hypothetical protein